MKSKVIILLFVSLFLMGQTILAKTQTSMTELNKLADEALQLTKFGRFEDAKNYMVQYGEKFSENGIVSKSLTIDEMRVLTTAYHEALKALNSVTLSQQERINKVTAFRLATDAVISKHQPLWSGMESSVLDALQNVKNAALEGDSELYNRELNKFLSIYSIIQPSIKIDLPVEEVQKLDSKMTYIDRNRSTFAEEKWLKELEQLEVDLKNMFTNVQKDDTDPSIWWVIMMTGGIIITTLSYVSWRKYKGQKLQKKRKDLND